MVNIHKKTSIFNSGDLFINPNFNGDVYRQVLVPKNNLNCPTSNITFSPGTITNWHTHAGGQILLVTDGFGWYQEDGKDALKLQRGSIVQIPKDVKHWHGACKHSWFTHVSITTNIDYGETTWLEPVSVEDYNKLSYIGE